MFFQDNWGIGALLERVSNFNKWIWEWFKLQNLVVKAVTAGVVIFTLWFIAKMISVILFGGVLVFGVISYFKS